MRPALELVHSDGSRSRYEADEGRGFVLVSRRRERIRVPLGQLQQELLDHLERLAFTSSADDGEGPAGAGSGREGRGLDDRPDPNNVHVSEAGLEPGDDGWFYPVCSCGATTGPLPDLETAVDWLMEHAYEAREEAMPLA